MVWRLYGHVDRFRALGDPGVERTQARFSLLVPFWALSGGFLRVARDPTGAFQWRTESEGKRWVSARTALMPGVLQLSPTWEGRQIAAPLTRCRAKWPGAKCPNRQDG